MNRSPCIAALGLLTAAAVFAQGYPGHYPPGGYPPGRYPGGSGGRLPIPRRGSKQQKKTEEQQAEALKEFRGIVHEIDAESLALQTPDGRTVAFKITPKTNFERQGEKIARTQLKPGDRLLIEASEDEQGFFTAAKVVLEAAPAQASDAPEPAAKTPPPPPPDDRPIIADDDDPGPPVLKRGKPVARRPAPQTQRRETASAVPPPSVKAPEPAVKPADAGLAKARAAAANFTQSLPNYVCEERIQRLRTGEMGVWKPLDEVTAEVVYENGQDRYRNIKISGKPVKKEMSEIGGAWSTGEFGVVLEDLFSPATAAEFRFRKNSTAAGLEALLYDFTVAREGSHWKVASGSQSVMPAYTGSVWIEKSTGRALRIEMQAAQIPAEFPLDKVESATEYGYVAVGDARYLLPVHAETLSCQRGTSMCHRNAIDFRNYHKYTGESTIIFSK